MKKLKYFFQTVIALLFCLFLIACSKVTQENYDKIKPNMTMQEVTAILGKPITSEGINIAGVSGTSAAWRDSKNQIDIQFINDRVTVKTIGKVNE